jgi:rhamnosyltransferase
LPTLNAARHWEQWVGALKSQSYQPETVCVIDSSSDDGTAEKARMEGFRVVSIDRKDFNHGGTRQMAVELLSEFDIFVFLTQDAILALPDVLENLVASFQDPAVGAAYGRQLAHPDAGCFGRFSRLMNYPSESATRTMADIHELGLKAAFLSNSFSAYRKDRLLAVGGFPSNVIFGEDMYVGARMLMAGWAIAYCADACVIHSHDYSIIQDVRRYFDMGAFHASEPWIFKTFGRAEKSGWTYVVEEYRYLLQHSPLRIPEAIVRTLARYFGYRTGLCERWIPRTIKRFLSMQPTYWGLLKN